MHYRLQYQWRSTGPANDLKLRLLVQNGFASRRTASRLQGRHPNHRKCLWRNIETRSPRDDGRAIRFLLPRPIRLVVAATLELPAVLRGNWLSVSNQAA